MKNISTQCILALFLLTASQIVYGQQSDSFAQINKDVWSKFYQAFDSLDYEPMAAIHLKDLIRITGNSKKISNYDDYIDGYKKTFAYAKSNKQSNTISLRFFERICNESTASERGIYRLIIQKDKEAEQVYYGQFHVLLKKKNGIWKILMDYDSNENNSIGKEAYDKAFPIDDFERFVKN